MNNREAQAGIIEPRRHSTTFSIVARILTSLADLPIKLEEVTYETQLIDDIGLDSIRFVDLTVKLEDALGLSEFPMQEWVDQCMAGDGRMTAGGLTCACELLLGGDSLDGTQRLSSTSQTSTSRPCETSILDTGSASRQRGTGE